MEKIVTAVAEQKGEVQNLGEKVEILIPHFQQNESSCSRHLSIRCNHMLRLPRPRSGRQTPRTVTLEQEKERAARQRKLLNLRIAGLVEHPEEVTKEVVISFFREQLNIVDPGVDSATRVGRNENGPRTILVRFSSGAGRASVLANRSTLKGQGSD
ncbi:hypothetical protein R1sor_027187 [Riccia sorocarpa]|uniref:Uncharacterized protein n=1 Tax=Riccia sorocarpa TaxID=122646 RepID=A0ABD3GJA1_9MARC